MQSHRPHVPTLTGRQVNLLLACISTGLLVTGVVSWGVGTGWARWWTGAHAILGLLFVLLLPRKSTTSVARGLRRGRRSRWLSLTMAVLAIATIVLGMLHSTGLWYGVGQWSALWTHTLLGFTLLPLLVWHAWSRPTRPRSTDIDRRLVLASGARLAAAGALVVGQEGVLRLVGDDRRFTGSREVASFDPGRLPSVSWINDSAPDLDPWPLRIGGRPVDVAELRGLSTRIEADLDCTGGWWSRQEWTVVPLADLLDLTGSRSVLVRSATGYTRRFPVSDAANTYLAIGYGDQDLRRRHGAPVRIVAPGRRGPWWVKWVTEVATSERPWWLQLPFPAT